MGLRAIRPIVIAHRGASGYRPEHTLEAYRLAIAMGADFIEPDLVPTRDGVLIARHENRLDDTTNIGDLVAAGDLPDRRATKSIDGEEVSGYFSEDYTLAEIKELRARERIPDVRPQNAGFNDRYEVPTFAEVIELARQTGVGIYPETKHPTYFRGLGFHIGRTLVATLVQMGFVESERVYIQSFEVANLIELRESILPECGVAFPLIQLLGAFDDNHGAFSRPFDRTPGQAYPTYSELATPNGLRWMKETYASGIGPWKDPLLPTLIRDARAVGLEVHPYTLRSEARFLKTDSAGVTLAMEDEIQQLLDQGATGFFTDHPDRGVSSRDAWCDQRDAHRR